jgi:hypothetical protein
MALLANGIETIELGSTAWRIVCNNNFSAIYTKDEVDNRTSDITFTTDTTGVVLVDRTTANEYRLYVDSGVLNIELVV